MNNELTNNKINSVPYTRFFLLPIINRCAMKQPFLLLLFLCFVTTQLAAQCPTGQSEVTILIDPDYYAASETDWYLYDSDGTLLASGSTQDATLCVSSSECLTFLITDTYGDGLTNEDEEGSYEVYYNDVLMDSGDDFGSEASVQFGDCAPGVSCYMPIAINAPGTFTAPDRDTWYIYEPDTTGTFSISTCTATCNTTVWVYDQCIGLEMPVGQEGTIFFGAGGCNNDNTLAKIQVGLQKNQLYYFRIGGTNACDGQTIPWTLNFEGPLAGCMDTAACNYNPLALIPDQSTCLYSPDANCPDGPDLKILPGPLASTIYVDTEYNSDECAVAEGCLAGYGTRKLLRFTTHIKNIGNEDYYVGSPSATDPQWEWDECHEHWHYEGYAEYLLYDANGVELPIGFKNGFCVLDLECSGGGQAKFGCNNQGISAGCGDIYAHYLDCQWIDVTNVASGTYTLVVRVNWDQSPDKLGRQELRYDNNWAQVCINLQHTGTNTASVSVVSTCDPYVDCQGEIYGTGTTRLRGYLQWHS